MKHHLRFLLKSLLALLLCGNAVSAAEPGTQSGNARIVFIGDSITGQGGGWLGTGYVFKMREALSAVYPECKHDLVPLGGSGMGVGSWLSLAKDVLVFKSCHRTWQWQQAINLTELDGSLPQGLEYRAAGPMK